MSKYCINVIYNDSGNINEIFKKSLINELRKYLFKINCKNNKNSISSSCTYLNLQNKEGK